MTARQILINYVKDFIEKNFDKFTCDFEDAGLPTDKDKLLKKLTFQTYCWVFTEAMSWCAVKDYIKPLIVEFEGSDDVGYTVFKINDKYIKIWSDSKFNYHVEFAKKKYKKILVFE